MFETFSNSSSLTSSYVEEESNLFWLWIGLGFVGISLVGGVCIFLECYYGREKQTSTDSGNVEEGKSRGSSFGRFFTSNRGKSENDDLEVYDSKSSPVSAVSSDDEQTSSDLKLGIAH